MTNTLPLKDKTAIVTGASSGMGRAIALTLANAGAYVFLCGRTGLAMQNNKQAIEDAGGKAEVVTADIRDTKQVQQLVNTAVEISGRLDIMVNCAGLSYSGSIVEGDPEQWRAMFETNVLALLAGCQAAVRAMRQCQAEGQIVNISSVVAQRNNSGVYGASKHAVNVISSSLRDELENDTIRVTNVMPGATATNFARHFDAEFTQTMLKMAGIETEVITGEHLSNDVLEQLAQNMKPLLYKPQDIANAVLYAVTQPIEVNIADIVVRPPKGDDCTSLRYVNYIVDFAF